MDLTAGSNDHELVVFCQDRAAGLRAIIAVHNTALGPGMGGTRFYPFATEQDALRDVLRLSRAMTYKAAIANVPFGGGKMVVMADPVRDKSPEFLRAIGRAIDGMAGRYITGEDVGTTLDDMATIGEETSNVMGRAPELGGSGDPSFSTARGVFEGILACVSYMEQHRSLRGLRVVVQGLGNVGWNLCALLVEAGGCCRSSGRYSGAVRARCGRQCRDTPATQCPHRRGRRE
jgi:leucine dehydrogenase